jgi:hypothetical protein
MDTIYSSLRFNLVASYLINYTSVKSFRTLTVSTITVEKYYFTSVYMQLFVARINILEVDIKVTTISISYGNSMTIFEHEIERYFMERGHFFLNE